MDFSEQSLQMFDCLLELKKFGMREVILCYVRPAGEDLSMEQRKALDELISSLEGAGIEPIEVEEQGDPVPMVLAVAEREKVSMIAMASSGKGRAREFFLGSTSFGILRSTRWPVLINKFQVLERGGEKKIQRSCRSIFHRALVPIDFSSCTPVAMDLIPKLSKLGLQESVLFHVVESAKANMDDDKRFKKVVDTVLKDLDGLRAELEAQGCNVTTHVHFGTVSYNILEASRELEVSLIVLGAHCKSLLHEVALGGNSEAVIRRSSVPLLIIPCER